MLAVKQAASLTDEPPLLHVFSWRCPPAPSTLGRNRLTKKDNVENAKATGKMFHRLSMASKPVRTQAAAQPIDPNNLYLPIETPSRFSSERSATIDWASGMNPARNKPETTYHADMLNTSVDSRIRNAKLLARRDMETMVFLFLYLSVTAPNTGWSNDMSSVVTVMRRPMVE